MDLPELLIQRGGSRLCGSVLLRIVHLQVPVDEVTLAKTNHLHTSKIKDYFRWSSQIWAEGSRFAIGASYLSTGRPALQGSLCPASRFSWSNTSFSCFKVKVSSWGDFLQTPEHIQPWKPLFRIYPCGWQGANPVGGTLPWDIISTLFSNGKVCSTLPSIGGKRSESLDYAPLCDLQ